MQPAHHTRDQGSYDRRDKNTQAHVPRGTASERSPPLGLPLSRTATMLLPTTTEALLGKVLDTRR